MRGKKTSFELEEMKLVSISQSMPIMIGLNPAFTGY